MTECYNGHINGTDFIDCDNTGFVLQRINTAVFTELYEVVSNIIGVTAHIRKLLQVSGVDAENGVFNCIRSDNGYIY